MNPEWEKWLESKPPKIQEAYQKWPFASPVDLKARGRAYVLGFVETRDGEMTVAILSQTDPRQDFVHANLHTFRICADFLPEVSSEDGSGT